MYLLKLYFFQQKLNSPWESKNYNIQELSDNENRKNAINDLKMSIPKLQLISKDDGLVEEVKKFLQQQEKDNLIYL